MAQQVHQCLLSNSKLEGIKKVYSHPQGLGQVQAWLRINCPHAERITVKSTGEAAQLAAVETGAAAVCSSICASLYGLNVVAQDIEDIKSKWSRVDWSCSFVDFVECLIKSPF
jgi:chorismate mutase/prephenate dehydratase